MTQLLVPDISDDLRDRLQVRARSHGRTLEEEAREILRAAVAGEPADESRGLGTRIASRFAEVGLDEPIRELRGWDARPAKFD